MVIQQLQKRLAEGKTEQVIEKLLEIVPEQHDLYQEIVLLSARFGNHSKTEMRNTSSLQEQAVSVNKINEALLSIIDKLPKNIATSQQKENRQPIVAPSTGKLWKWIVGIGLLLVIPVAVAEFSGYSLRDLFSSITSRIASNTVLIKIQSQNKIVLPPKGKVYLTYGNAQVGKEVNNNDEAIFTEVPQVYFEDGNQVKITFKDPQGEPYYAVFEDSIYQLRPNQNIELLVALKGLDKLFGIIKHFETGEYIEGARVNVLDLETYSDKYGWWKLEIKQTEDLRKFHTLRVSKEGYHNWEMSNIPPQTQTEISILLKPK